MWYRRVEAVGRTWATWEIRIRNRLGWQTWSGVTASRIRMSGNMEQNPCGESAADPSSQQFREKLNQWFEQHGVLDNLRSHLRSVMIAALQQTEFRLKPHQKTTPKIQSANLLVAEYLLKQGCHYTLSILMSELPALANFASGAILFQCGPERKKSKEKYRFEDKEVIEILNSLGISSQDENVKLICDCYNQRRDDESLLECLLRFVGRIQPEGKNIRRWGAGTEELPGYVTDAPKEESMENHRRISPRQFLSMMSEGDLKRAVEEENERRMMELIERERRIQDYLRIHEEEIVERLKSAEKELNSRRETIDRELSERQLHLGRIAFQLKEKHSEIIRLSGNFATVKSENVTLRSKLDSVQVELNELREEFEKKCEIIERLEAERMSVKRHVQEYIKWKGRGMDGEAVASYLRDGVRRKIRETKDNRVTGNKQSLRCGSSQDDSPSSEESSGEESLLGKVKSRVEELYREDNRISEKYSRYRKKYENQVDDSELVEEPNATVIDVPREECVAVPETSVEAAEREMSWEVRQEVKDVGEEFLPVFEEPTEAIQLKKSTVGEEKRLLIPTRRQQKHLDYYNQSRTLLEALEKGAGFVEENGSTSDPSCSWSSKIDSEQVGKAENAKVKENVSFRESGLRDLSDLECLTLLKEATRPGRKDGIGFQAPASIVRGDEGG